MNSQEVCQFKQLVQTLYRSVSISAVLNHHSRNKRSPLPAWGVPLWPIKARNRWSHDFAFTKPSWSNTLTALAVTATSVLQSAGLLNEFSSSCSLERKRVGGKLFGFLITSQFPHLVSSCSRKQGLFVCFFSKKCSDALQDTVCSASTRIQS